MAYLQKLKKKLQQRATMAAEISYFWKEHHTISLKTFCLFFVQKYHIHIKSNMYHNKNTNVKQNPFPRANAKRSDQCFTKCKAKTTHQQSLLVLVQQATLSAARLGF